MFAQGGSWENFNDGQINGEREFLVNRCILTKGMINYLLLYEWVKTLWYFVNVSLD